MKSILLLPLLLIGCSGPKSETQNSPDSTANGAIEVVQNPGPPPVDNPRTVIDFYELLAWSAKVDLFRFFEVKGKWVCVEDMGDDYPYLDSLHRIRHYPVVVDIKNAYLQIEDEGTGGGTLFTEVALFSKTDKSYLIAKSSYSVDPYSKEGDEPDFYVWKENHFENVNAAVFPELTPSLFFTNGYQPGTTKTYFTLPREGTDIAYHITSASSAADSAAIKTDGVHIRFDKKREVFVK